MQNAHLTTILPNCDWNVSQISQLDALPGHFISLAHFCLNSLHLHQQHCLRTVRRGRISPVTQLAGLVTLF